MNLSPTVDISFHEKRLRLAEGTEASYSDQETIGRIACLNQHSCVLTQTLRFWCIILQTHSLIPHSLLLDFQLTSLHKLNSCLEVPLSDIHIKVLWHILQPIN